MELFHQILQAAVEHGASDVHLKINTPVVFRINRELVYTELPRPTAEWMSKVVQSILPAHLAKRIDEEHEADFSYVDPSGRRFRTNLFHQRGEWCLALRLVKTQVP